MLRHCKETGCKTKPTYGTEWKKPLYCKSHSKPGMEDVVNKQCLEEGCKTLPTYGTEWKKPLYCKSHSKPGMENVVNKQCLEEGCKTQPTYGTHLIGRVYCAKHTDRKKMWKIVSCKQGKCKNVAIYSKTGMFPYEYCDDHAPVGYLSTHTSTCVSCGLSDMVCDEKGKCLLSCTEIHKERQKFSENAMKSLFDKKKLKYTANDKTVSDGCSKKRPDFVFETPYGVIIVENDENQHKSRPCECEQQRMLILHQDFGENVHFIRFNPDRYKADNIVWNLSDRHKVLAALVKDLLKHSQYFFENHPHLTVRYMYYDDCNGKFDVQKIEY